MLVKELINILFILITALFDKYSQPELTQFEFEVYDAKLQI